VSQVVHESPILDYAGPASRSALRLAAQSELHIHASAERLVVRETLAGQGGAIAALVFAAFVLLLMFSLEVDMAHKWRRTGQQMALLAGFMVA